MSLLTHFGAQMTLFCVDQSVDAMSRRGHVRGVAELSQDEQEALAALSALGAF